MEYFFHLATLSALFGIFAISLNLVAGYTGLISLAHAAFYGIGAYATALLMVGAGLNFFVALFLGALLAGAVALIVGFVFSRLSGDYYVIATVGFTYILFTAFLNWNDVTGGPLGVAGIKRPELFGFSFADSALFLALTLLFLVGTYLVSRFIGMSSFGRVLTAIREDEKAVSVFGYDTTIYKLAIFVISASLAALGGGLLASYLRFIDPWTFSLNESILVLSMVILGGLGSLRGPVVGALILILLPEALRFVGFSPDFAAQIRHLLYGLVLVVLMLYRPQGLFGEYKL